MNDFTNFDPRNTHDNCYYRCATCGAFTHYSEAHGCGVYATHEYSDGCGCKSCYNMRAEHDANMRAAVDTSIPHVNGCACVKCKIAQVERNMRAATCKCGHVGAECFNDEWCAQPAIDPVVYLKAMLANATKQIADLHDTINDLQADYAGDIQAWSNMYNSLSETHYGEEWKELDRIEELETTIRVLSGMIE